MYSKKNKISRSDFLKTSGVTVGGFVALSHYGCFGDMNTLKELVIEGKTNYSIVLPSQATAHEQNAAETLQLFLSKMSSQLEVINEQKYRGENAIYVGKTNYALRAELNPENLDEDAKMSGVSDFLSGQRELTLDLLEDEEEFMHRMRDSFIEQGIAVDDLSKACLFILENWEFVFKSISLDLSLIHI